MQTKIKCDKTQMPSFMPSVIMSPKRHVEYKGPIVWDKAKCMIVILEYLKPEE